MDLLIAYKDQVLRIGSFLALPFLAFLISLGVVYLLGRMLGVVDSPRGKNVIAFMAMVGSYVFYFCKIDTEPSVMERVWAGAVYLAATILLYVLVGFRLYDRVDEFLDKRFGRDKPVKPSRRKG